MLAMLGLLMFKDSSVINLIRRGNPNTPQVCLLFCLLFWNKLCQGGGQQFWVSKVVCRRDSIDEALILLQEIRITRMEVLLHSRQRQLRASCCAFDMVGNAIFSWPGIGRLPSL